MSGASPIDEMLASGPDWGAILDEVLRQFNCTTGTIHDIDPGTGMLRLLAHRGIPDELLQKVTLIPIGKGIAGAAAERREPVELCNLQTDDSGVARPDAKKTRVAGSLAVPLLKNGELKGTLGIGKFVPYDFSAAETAALETIGARIVQAM